MGLFDLEVNCLTKILFGALVALVALVMVALPLFKREPFLKKALMEIINLKIKHDNNNRK